MFSFHPPTGSSSLILVLQKKHLCLASTNIWRSDKRFCGWKLRQFVKDWPSVPFFESPSVTLKIHPSAFTFESEVLSPEKRFFFSFLIDTPVWAQCNNKTLWAQKLHNTLQAAFHSVSFSSFYYFCPALSCDQKTRQDIARTTFSLPRQNRPRQKKKKYVCAKEYTHCLTERGGGHSSDILWNHHLQETWLYNEMTSGGRLTWRYWEVVTSHPACCEHLRARGNHLPFSPRSL